jgi:hypothetical protein
MSYLKAYAVLLALLVFSPVSHALHWNLFQRLCPQEMVEIPPMIEDLPIPVGCEVIDCCPGCPGPGFIDWRIRIDENLLRGARLRIEGLSEKQLSELKLSGNARLDKQGVIQLGSGEIGIAGIPEQVNGQVPLAFISPQLRDDEATLKKTAALEQDAMDPDDAPDFGTGIEVRQFRGNFQVNRFRSRFVLVPCPRPISGDYLKLTNNIASDNAVAMVDYRVTGCHNDFTRRLVNSEFLGNVLSNGACRSTVSIFSDDNAMSYQPNVTTWTDALGDEHTVNLQGIITVPVSVWVANNAMQVRAQNDFANANLLYNRNNVGIQFNPTYTSFAGDAAAAATIGTWCPTAATVGALQGSAWYTASTLNAYYVNSAFTGVNCGQDRNMNFIGTIANLGSLPHEFGHAYGLRPSGSNGHTNGVAGFGNNNIMWGGGPGTRDHFSVGQAFRLNTDTSSMLNANGDRTGPTETCLPNVSSTICPTLSLDSLPH